MKKPALKGNQNAKKEKTRSVKFNGVIRVFPEEEATINRNIKDSNLTKTEFIRQRLLNTEDILEDKLSIHKSILEIALSISLQNYESRGREDSGTCQIFKEILEKIESGGQISIRHD